MDLGRILGRFSADLGRFKQDFEWDLGRFSIEFSKDFWLKPVFSQGRPNQLNGPELERMLGILGNPGES